MSKFHCISLLHVVFSISANFPLIIRKFLCIKRTIFIFRYLFFVQNLIRMQFNLLYGILYNLRFRTGSSLFPAGTVLFHSH